MSTNPAKRFGLYPRKGVIVVGSDADLVLYDPEGHWLISHADLHSKAGHSLYDGLPVVGRPVMTLLRGHIVMQDGQLVAARPTGRFLHRTTDGSGLLGCSH